MPAFDTLLTPDHRAAPSPSTPGARRSRRTRGPTWRGRRSLPEALTADDPKIRRSAADALCRSRCATFVTSPLIELMEDEHPEVRRAAIRLLGAYGDARALEPLRALARDYVHAEAGEAGKALGALERRTEDWESSPSAVESGQTADLARRIQEARARRRPLRGGRRPSRSPEASHSSTPALAV